MKNSIHDFRLIIILQPLLIFIGCNRVSPPVADQIPSEKVIHGVRISDPYKWMEDPKDPKTASYIRAENEYADHYFSHLSKLKNKLLKEFEERDNFERQRGSVPVLIGNYFYYKRIPDGRNFPVRYRKLNGDDAKEELVLDENLLAKGARNFSMDHFLVSPDNSKFLCTYTVNSDQCRLIIKNFNNRPCVDSIIGDISGAAWAADGKSVVYVMDEKEVMVHQIGTPVEQDKTIYLEKRDDLYVDVDLSESAKYIFITSYNNESTECSYIPADLKNLKPLLIEPLRDGHRYFVDHFGSNFFLILSNQDARNRKLFKTFISVPSEKNWITVLEGNDSIYVDNYTVIDQKYLLLLEKKKLNASLRLIDLAYGGKDNQITFKEPDGHMEFLYFDKEDQKVVFSFASMLTPVTIYCYDLDSRKLTIRRQPSIKDYKKENYIVDLIWATLNDGTKIPISMIHKNGMKQSDGRNPLYLTANDPTPSPLPLKGRGRGRGHETLDFNPVMISLLDRGFFLVCAHIKKKNAIGDYIACAEYLIKQGYTTKGMITAAGSSAGGLVIGAALNERPDLFRSALLLMPSVGLTGHSPYDNIKKQEYPAMLFRTSLQDQNVAFSGPLKMVARLRANKTDKNILLIKTDDRKTHTGNAGVREDNEIRAENWAFILDQYGIE